MKKNTKKTEDRTDLEKFQDAFIQEVDEDLKNDNLRKMWNKYGLYIITFVVIVVTSAVSFESFKAWNEKRNQTWSDKYAYALNLQIQGKYDDSMKVLGEIIENNHDAYTDLAKVQVSNVYFEQGKTADAISELEKIVKDENVNSKIRDVSLFKLASYKLDSAPREEIEGLLSPLLVDGNSWANIAKEMLAMLEIREGNVAEAKKLYGEILASPNLPDVLKLRVQDMLSVLDDVQ